MSKDLKLAVVGFFIVAALAVHSHIPVAVEVKLAERIISIIIVAMLTELVFEKFGLTGDYGLLTYALSLSHPAVFPLAAVTLHGTMPNVPVISDLQAMLLGNEYRARHRGVPNLYEVHSEHNASNSIASIAAETNKSYYLRETIVFLMLVAVFTSMHGGPGFILAVACFACYTVLQTQGGSDEIVRTKEVDPIEERQGVYAIEVSNLWMETHVGVGYLYNGTFTTKYHVTNGKPIMIGSKFYNPCYYNTKADIVSYGSPPDLCDVEDGDDILVALSGPYSDVIVTYAAKATVNDDGYILFTGKKSVPGTSGSPFFKKYTDEEGKLKHKFAGCIGWSLKDPKLKSNEITEIAMNTGLGFHTQSISRGEIVQHLGHPGSGKTRNISSLIQQGLKLYNRVYIAGPTRGVSAELLAAYEDNPIEGVSARVLIKDTRRSRAPSKLTITTHSTALRMLLKRDTTMTQPGLWIIDEAHFPDKSTQALKHYLRHNITKKKMNGSLYEMTATAYDLKEKKWCYCYGSNYPITDTIMTKFDMLKALKTESRKAIVFVTSIKGKEHSSSHSLKESLAAEGKKVLEINRANFTKSYPKAKSGEYDVILTTNISECGVNLDVDVCYDFQEGPKPLVQRWDDIAIRGCTITRSQYVQRRGRVGRKKEGEYIGPKSRYELTDVIASDAYHLDVAIFLKNFDVEAMEPTYLTEEASYYTCTHEQVMYLFAEGEDAAINSPLTLQMVVDNRGNLRDTESVMDHVRRWNSETEVSRVLNGRTAFAKYWDDRDADFYWNWKNILDGEPLHEEERASLMDAMRQNIHRLGKAIKNRGTWLRRTSVQREYEISESEEESTGEAAPPSSGSSRTRISEIEEEGQ